MFENHSKPPWPFRSLTADEINSYRGAFDGLASEFEEHWAALRTPDDLTALPAMRGALSRAGRLLMRLLHQRAIAAPPSLPPWLSWRTPGRSRPRFTGMRGRPCHYSGSRRTVLGLVRLLRAGPEALDTATERSPNEDDVAVFIRRQTWIEAVAGWLGQRCTPRTTVIVPTVKAVIDTGSNDTTPSAEAHMDIVLDWVEDTTQQRLLFLDLARDSAAACREVSDELKRFVTVATPHEGRSPLAWPTVLSTFDALDDLRTDASHGSGAAGLEAFDALFGLRNLHDEFAAIAARRNEFKRTFAGRGQPYQIADFAVISGHEAVAVLADRVVRYAGVQRKSISRAREAVERARATEDRVRTEKGEADLDLAGEEFCKAVNRALAGIDEHRSWIRRGIEDESLDEASSDASATTHANTATEPPQHPFPSQETMVRTPEDAARELDALLKALSPFEHCRGPVESWTDDLRARRFPVWFIWPKALQMSPPARFKDTWWAFGHGWLVMTYTDCSSIRRYEIDVTHPDSARAVARAGAARAMSVPDAVRETLLSALRTSPGVAGDAGVVVFIRNEWHERRDLVGRLRERIRVLVDSAARGVRRVGGDAGPLNGLMKDDLLIDETVDLAIASLRMVGTGSTTSRPLSSPKGTEPPLASASPPLEADAGSGSPTNLSKSKVPTRADEHAVDASAPRPRDASPGFFRDGDGWTVEFGGERRVLRDLAGMVFIQRLLASAGVPIATGDLAGQLDAAQSEQEVVDPKTLRDARKRLKEIGEELSDNPALTPKIEEDLQRERESILEHVKKVTTLRGARPMKSNSKQAAGRVRVAIHRALEAIKKVHLALWQHLDEALIGAGGASPCYRPSPPVTWRVNA